jgi:hypothetical protein
MARHPHVSGLTDWLDSRATRPGRVRETIGIAFSVPELLALTEWAEEHGMQVVIELDTCVDGAEYEEVAAFYLPDHGLRCWSLWRARDAIVLERMSSPELRGSSVIEVLDNIQLWKD